MRACKKNARPPWYLSGNISAERQVGTARVYEVHARQSRRVGDFHEPELLLHSDREKSSARDRGIVGEYHRPRASDATKACNEAARCAQHLLARIARGQLASKARENLSGPSTRGHLCAHARAFCLSLRAVRLAFRRRLHDELPFSASMASAAARFASSRSDCAADLSRGVPIVGVETVCEAMSPKRAHAGKRCLVQSSRHSQYPYMSSARSVPLVTAQAHLATAPQVYSTSPLSSSSRNSLKNECSKQAN